MTDVSIADSVTAAGNNCFKDCASLKQIKLGSGLPRLPTYMFSGCSSLESVEIPGNVTVIGAGVFWKCSALKEVHFSNGLEQIGNGAFTQCSSLEKLIIPYTVTKVFGTAFWNSENLSEIYFCGAAPTFGSNAFKGITATVYYPEDETGWTADVQKQYSGTITWKSWNPCENGHTGNPEFKWSADRTSCTAEFDCLACGKAQSKACTVTSTTTATCTQEGETVYTASVTLADAVYTDIHSVNTPALGHTEVIDAAQAATCTVDGKTEGSHCSVCGETIKAQETVPAEGHTEVIDAAQAATCTVDGKTEGSHCSVCGEIIKAQETVPAEGHTEVIDAARAATCTVDGKTEGSHCSVCGETIRAQETIPAAGHSWDEGKVTKQPSIGEIGIRTYTCTVCGAAKMEQIPALRAVYDIFTDVSRDGWYVTYIQHVYDRGLMTGMSEDTFGTYQPLSRAMIAQILYSYAGKPEVSGDPAFTDVKPDAWYYDAVQWASKNNVVSGFGDGIFKPNVNVTREQLAVMLYAHAGKPEVSGSLSAFGDYARVSSWAKDALLWATQNGIMTGSVKEGKNYLDPKGDATRAQTAVMLMQYLK